MLEKRRIKNEMLRIIVLSMASAKEDFENEITRENKRKAAEIIDILTSAFSKVWRAK